MVFASVLAWMLVLGSTGCAETRGDFEVEPQAVRLIGPESTAQLILTSDVIVTYESLDPAVVAVDHRGSIRAVGNGSGRIRVYNSAASRIVSVTVAEAVSDRPIDFGGEIAPIFTRLGCNSGACHGKSTGQNGFRLSLFGFEPGLDHQSLVRDLGGRRVDALCPSESLILRKPTMQVAHGGGKRLESDSPEFRALKRWVEQGTPFRETPSRRLSQLTIEPRNPRVIPLGHQQLRVVATYDDGSTVDVTRLARFESLGPDLAQIDDSGRITALDATGEGMVLARYASGVGLIRIMIPRETPARGWISLPPRNFIDEQIDAKLEGLRIPPSPPAEDFEFARRSTLDICGVLPSRVDVQGLIASRDPEKRIAWIDRLLKRSEYADRFAMFWSPLLRNRRTLGSLSQPGTFAFHSWIRQAIAENMPYDGFVSAILTATGDTANHPAAVWSREARPIEAVADDTAQLFLGVRLQCARCHHHPYEPWSQDDYSRFADIFRRVGRKPGIDAFSTRVFLLPNPPGSAPRLIGGPALTNNDQDPRKALADWLGRPDNPYFAKAVVNRYWKIFFGRGLVDPEDDLRPSNPPSHPELLDALANDFVTHGFDLKRLVRTIATSRAYERSSLATSGNESDRRNLARFPMKRMPAEVFLDAIDTLAGTSEAFAGLPRGTRATQLPDEGFDTSSRFLDVFGRPKRESVCECERSNEPSLSQGLHLFNSPEIERKVAHPEGRASRWSVENRGDLEMIETLYWIAFSRPPDLEERSICVDHLKKSRMQGALPKGLEDLIWTIVNTKEFAFVR